MTSSTSAGTPETGRGFAGRFATGLLAVVGAAR